MPINPFDKRVARIHSQKTLTILYQKQTITNKPPWFNGLNCFYIIDKSMSKIIEGIKLFTQLLSKLNFLLQKSKLIINT